MADPTPLARHPEVRSALDLLEAWVEAQRVARDLPGLSMGIVHEQEVLWAAGFGWADVERHEPATADTLYRIGSITKVFTATALLLLRDDGRIQLDDPLARHLPWFEMRAGAADPGTITIRHLLTHTAGLPREGAFPYFTDGRFPGIDETGRGYPSSSAHLRWRLPGSTRTLARRSPARW